MSYTNSQIVTAALSGKDAENGRGSMSTEQGRSIFISMGYLPTRLKDILRSRAHAGHVDQIIYSYATPIAWLDEGAWVVPTVTYSITTSAKHQTHLYRLPNRVGVPWDCGQEDYLAFIGGTSRYVHNYRGGVGTVVAA